MSIIGNITCTHCGGELGLRERYERLLELLEASLVVYNANNKFEQNQENPDRAQELMQASVQMYNVIQQYWNDIPGENIKEKLTKIDDKRLFERKKDGKFGYKENLLN